VEAVHRRISAAGGDPHTVRLLAVTKGVGAERVRAALRAGLTDLGESYAQEVVAKVDALGEETARWHFIGGLQRNKVRQIAGFVHVWQSVDRLSLAAEIARHAPGAAVLVQVDLSGAENRSGCPPERVAAVVEGSHDLGLDVRGLMAIGRRGAPAQVRAGFALVRELAEGLGLPELSMGMSGDLEEAVAEGSTMIRVGTALFGPRSRPETMGN